MAPRRTEVGSPEKPNLRPAPTSERQGGTSASAAIRVRSRRAGALVESPCHDALVTRDHYADRLDPSTYQDDDDTVGLFETSPSEPDSLWLSGRLFHRLTGVAVAYELHTLAQLRALDDDRLNRARLESLFDEVAFVADRLNDPLATETAQAISNYVAARLNRPMWDGSITFQGD